MMMKHAFYRVKGEPLPVRKGESLSFERYDRGNWVKETGNRLRDLYMGYDPDEPPGSPYGIGNALVMEELEMISEEEAMRMIREAEKQV